MKARTERARADGVQRDEHRVDAVLAETDGGVDVINRS